MLDIITENIDVWTSAQLQKTSSGRGKNKNGEQTAYGIKKLRELILELAVRGKLVPQDPNDEPARVLLKRIAAEKNSPSKEGSTNKQKENQEIKGDETPFTLPKGWVWVSIGNISQHNSGKMLHAGKNKGKNHKYITTSNLYWGYFNLEDLREMQIMDEELDKCTAKKGDLLICEGGEAGRSAVWNENYDICFQNHVHRVRLFGYINPFYIYRCFERLDLTGEIKNYRKGVGISNLSGKSLSSIIVPLPPLSEQHRIVAKVDELMALCDQLEQQRTSNNAAHQTLVETLVGTLTASADNQEFQENWSRIEEHFNILFTTEFSIDQLKQTILQLAVMGKLVPQDSNDEPASKLLEKINKEKERLIKEGKIKNQKPLSEISDEEKLFVPPASWEWVKFDYIAENSTNALKAGPFGSALKKSMYVEKGYKIYGQEQVISGDENYGDYYIDQEKYISLESCAVKPGDILISLVGTIGKVLVLSNNSLPGIINPRLVKLSLYSEIYRRYIQQMLASPLVQMELGEKCHGGTMNILNLGLIRSLTFPLPPIEEQKRIVAKVDELMTLCDDLKSKINDIQTTQLHLADAIVERAIA